jgi:hypothetical protein
MHRAASLTSTAFISLLAAVVGCDHQDERAIAPHSSTSQVATLPPIAVTAAVVASALPSAPRAAAPVASPSSQLAILPRPPDSESGSLVSDVPEPISGHPNDNVAGPIGIDRGVVTPGALSVSGQLPPEVVKRILQQMRGRFRHCYDTRLASNPALQGHLELRFVVGHDGSVGVAEIASSRLADAEVGSCITRAMLNATFPAPPRGVVVVLYKLSFSPLQP